MRYRNLTVCTAVLFACGPICAIAATQTLSISECREVETCDAEQKCVAGKTRLVIAQHHDAEDGMTYLSMGPMTENVGGGLFFQQDWQVVEAGVDAPSDAIGRAYLLASDTNGAMTAHVYRPGREVRGLSSEWVRTDFTCTQVLF